MGVLYHLRYPLLALDILSERTRERLVLQTLTMPGEDPYEVKADYPLNERTEMLESGWPKMAFIENKLNGDPTNWWAPNVACVEAMLRSCGFRIIARPCHEVFICEPNPQKPGVTKTWNRSEYLSVIGDNWQLSYEEKVKK
jgi:tRNA (mo5U34)-methyltransferase